MRYLLDVSNTGSNGDVVSCPEDDDFTYQALLATTYDDEGVLNKPWYSVIEPTNAAVTLEPPFGTVVGAFTPTSGTGKQDKTGKASKVYLQITGGSAGTVAIAISKDDSTYHTIVAATAANAVASQVIPVDLPANWYLKVTVSVATIAAGVQVA